MSRLGDLYDRDFMLWTQEQSAALRRAKGANLPLDWDNLAEEIESLGISQRHGLRSQVTRILLRAWRKNLGGLADHVLALLGERRLRAAHLVPDAPKRVVNQELDDVPRGEELVAERQLVAVAGRAA